MENEEIYTVSVIIPMYNAEKYIEECLTSLVNQTLKNFEVIVVDDCSTDHSLAVAKKTIPLFATQNIKFSIITFSKNSGCPGIPRNVTIDFAKGKYVYFLDSDDFLDETVLEEFYKVAEEFVADVVHAQKSFKYAEINGKFENQLINLDKGKFLEKPTLETFDIDERIKNFVEKNYNTLVWNKFFRREFLLENNIKFPAITVSEDFIFSLMCLTCAKNYVRIPFIGHHYRKRAGSMTNSSATTATASLNLVEGVYVLDSFMKRQKFFIDNPKYRYLIIDAFNLILSNLIFKHIFFEMDLEAGDIYSFYCKDIFTVNPQKNIPLTAYLFTSTNIYKMLVNQQAAEIAKLKKILKENQ